MSWFRKAQRRLFPCWIEYFSLVHRKHLHRVFSSPRHPHHTTDYMKMINSDYLTSPHYLYDFSATNHGECEFVGWVVIKHSYDTLTRTRYTGDKIKATFCEAKYKIKILIQSGINIKVSILDSGGRLRQGLGYHIYEDWSCCFGAPQDIKLFLQSKDWIDMERLYEDMIVSFFYNQTYYSDHGKWILWEYWHGDIGVIERYARENTPDKDFTYLTLKCLSEERRKEILSQTEQIPISGPLSEYHYWYFRLVADVKKYS